MVFLMKIIVLLSLILLLLFFGCTYFTTYSRVDHSDSVLQFAEKECGINKATPESNDCYVRIALENKKPEVCLLANPAIDDWCIQDYYEKRNTIDACEEIKKVKSGCLKGCLDYYSQSNHFACNSYSVEDCPEQCVICPPCIECSSISCQSEEFCESIGFDKSWYTTS